MSSYYKPLITLRQCSEQSLTRWPSRQIVLLNGTATLPSEWNPKSRNHIVISFPDLLIIWCIHACCLEIVSGTPDLIMDACLHSMCQDWAGGASAPTCRWYAWWALLVAYWVLMNTTITKVFFNSILVYMVTDVIIYKKRKRIFSLKHGQ